MKTYQDLLAVGENERERMLFVQNAISEHKFSTAYQSAVTADSYLHGENETISKYEKVLYDITGQAQKDIYSANHKYKSNFFNRFMIQRASYLLKNGVAFDEDDTKEKLGRHFETKLYRAVKDALAESVSFGFFNLDHIEFFKLTEFVPLYDEEDGALKAGIRFWQIDSDKPLRATLYELDGYTDYIQISDEPMKVRREKRAYVNLVKSSPADGETIFDSKNYPSFPIVPLWANPEHVSALHGKRAGIDIYDLIKSGFANDISDTALVYWTLKNSGGMDDVDLAEFRRRLKTIGVAGFDTDETQAESHVVDVPYQSREACLSRAKKDLYEDFMALDVDQIAAGNVTATQIEASYEPLDEACFDLKNGIIEFIESILELAGINDKPTLTPHRISNQQEATMMILSAAEYLDEETVLRKLPFLADDEIDDIIKRRAAEDLGRFSLEDEETEGTTE